MTRTITPVMLTVKEVAKYLGIGETNVWYLIRTRELASIEIPGRGAKCQRRIMQTDLDKFIAEHYQPATQ